MLIPDLIDRAADKRPDDPAAGFLDDWLSYAELVAGANRLANLLVECGVSRGDRVGIFMDKSVRVPIAMYGILKCGAAYVPLDPAAPAGRLAAIVADCGIRVVVSSRTRLKSLRALIALETPLRSIIGVDADLPTDCVGWEALESFCGSTPPAGRHAENDLAYIMYTSGSTGVPKGIMHTHRSCLSYARWAAREYGLLGTDRLANQAPLHFDISIFDYFAGAIVGAATVIVPEDYPKLPASYSSLLADQRVSVLFTVPFALMQLLDRGMLDERDLTALRWVIFGGEPFPTGRLKALMAALPGARFDNMYGPAEVNGCTHYTVPASIDAGSAVPIGPIADIAAALVIDENDMPLPVGAVGELLVRTPTMMQGYWNRPDLNARAFYSRLAESGPNEVFYRTGDLVSCDEQGLFHFHGRMDRQIKVRGFRVELDEIEAELASLGAVEQSAVFALPDGSGSQKIHAVVALRPDSAVAETELLSRLKQTLPWYAVPTSLQRRAHLPRTTSGKVDRVRLRDEVMLAERSA